MEWRRCLMVVQCCFFPIFLATLLLLVDIIFGHGDGLETPEERVKAIREVLFNGEDTWYRPGYSHITLEQCLANIRTASSYVGSGKNHSVFRLELPQPPSGGVAEAGHYVLRENEGDKAFSSSAHVDALAADLMAQRLVSVKNPWFVPAVAQFIPSSTPTEKKVYSVHRLLQGLTLARVHASLKQGKQPPLTTLEECFYRTEKIIALGEFHRIYRNGNAVYWDVKDDNMGMDRDGHLVLIDYGGSTLYPESSTNSELTTLKKPMKELWKLGYYGVGYVAVDQVELPTAEKDWEKLSFDEEITSVYRGKQIEKDERKFFDELRCEAKPPRTADDLLERSTSEYVKNCYNSLREAGHFNTDQITHFSAWLAAMKEKSPLLTVPFLPGVLDSLRNFKPLHDGQHGDMVATQFQRQFITAHELSHPVVVAVVGKDRAPPTEV